MQISGLGDTSVSLNATALTADDRVEAQERFDMAKNRREAVTEEAATARGIWTLVFGVLLIMASIALMLRWWVQWAVFAVLPAGVLAVVGVSAILVSPAGMLDSGGDDSLDYEFSRDYALYVVFAASVIAVLCAVGALVALIRTGGSPTDSPVRHDSYVPPVRSQWSGPPPTGRWPGPPNAPYRNAGPPPPYRGQPPSSGPPNLR